MKYSTHPLCGCTDPDTGKPYGQRCPRLHRADGSWNPRHGSMGWAARVTTTSGTKPVKRYGYASKAKAEAAAEQVGKLLDLAPDDITRARIGDLIVAARRGQPLPAVEDVRRRLGLGVDPGQPGVAVADWLDSWLAGKTRTKRASTVRMYESHVRVYIRPVIGDLPLERLNTGHIEQVLAGVPGSPATRHRVMATLRAALNAAIKQRKITHNPCAGIELEPENPPEQQSWTPEQVKQFIGCVADDPLGLAYRVMVLTGCRRAELCGFRWAGADLEVHYRDPETGERRTGAVLTVARTIVQLGGKIHEEATAKSRAGDRLVFLDHDTAALLREHHQAQRKAQMAAPPGAWQDHGLVFCQPDGRPWMPDHISKRFKRLAAQAGVPVIKLHEGGRHTGNSVMRAAGVDQELRMRMVGHASRDINDHYTHMQIAAGLAAAAKAGAHVRKAGERT